MLLMLIIICLGFGFAFNYKICFKRGGGQYEDDIFYDLCDQYGILIFHDLMFANGMYVGDGEFLENIK